MSKMESKRWIDICALEEIPLRGARVVKTPRGCIALFRTIDNEVFALDDKCPHRGGPLSQGIVHGRSVTCPLHNMVVSLETGSADGDDEGSVQTRRARLAEGRVHLMLHPGGV